MRRWRYSRFALTLALAQVLLVGSTTAGAGERTATGSWAEYGAGPQRASDAVPTTPSSLRRSFVLPISGRITSQVLYAGGLFYVSTSAGKVVSFDRDGYVHWRVDLGQLAHSCPELDGYGVTGTGAIDAASGTLYVADAFGRLHALALATGAERAGWPVRVFTDYRRQLVWGALSLVGGAVYVPTASYCDAPMVGGMYRVTVASRKVTQWISVAPELGGGGGVWGWGGSAYSAKRGALYVVTANALSGGTNTGESFDEAAGYGEKLVELGTDLSVVAASHPADIDQPLDLDFVGSPVVLERPGCGELVVAANKNDTVYAWRAGDVAAGPIWQVQLEPFNPANPMLSQVAWSSSRTSVYAATGTQLVRIAVGENCSPRVLWKRPLGTKSENGSPTIAGDTVWLARSGKPTLNAYDAGTGKRVSQTPLGGTAVVGPTVVDGRVVLGTMAGFVEGFAFGGERRVASVAAPVTTGSAAIGVHQSWVGSRYGWQSRSTGVFATNNGGASWARIHAEPALAVLRLSRRAGLIELGSKPGACMCATRKLWTGDGGVTWHQTSAVGDRFAGAGGTVYWWGRGSLKRETEFPPVSRKRQAPQVVASIPDGTIVAAALVPGGVVALVSNRVGGHHWDVAPRVIVVRAGTSTTVRLPSQRGRILVRAIQASWPTVTVTGTAYGPDPVRAVTWTSTDGGTTWRTG